MRFFTRSPDLEAGKRKSKSNQPSAMGPTMASPIGPPHFSGDGTVTSKPPESVPMEPLTGRQNQPNVTSRLEEFLEKYDPRSVDVPNIFPMSEHRTLIRTMLLDNILHNASQLNKHNWILHSQNEMYKKLATPTRNKRIEEDLERYIRSIKNYEYWMTCWVQQREIDASAIPPSYQTYGRTLAILECASHNPVESERAIVAGLAEGITLSLTQWAVSNARYRRACEVFNDNRKTLSGLLSRVLRAVIGGASLIVPMVIMTIFTSTIATLATVSASTLMIGLVLAIWMVDAENKDIIAATAAYAAVLVVFVGTGNPGPMAGMGKQNEGNGTSSR